MSRAFEIPTLALAFVLVAAAPARAQLGCAWEERANLATERYEGAGGVVGGKLYVFGGFDDQNNALTSAEVYDPLADTWLPRAPMPHAVTHVNGAVDGTTIWIAGGFVGDHPGAATDVVLRYDTLADAWLPGPWPALPAQRAGGALVLRDRALHYFGGYLPDRKTSSSDHWILDLDAVGAGWQVAAPLPLARGHVAGACVGDAVYAIGGQVGHDPYVGPNGMLWPFDVVRVDRYDPASDTWTQVADMLAPRSHHEMATFVLGGRIYSANGISSATTSKALDRFQMYDPPLDRWSALPPLPVPLSGCWLALVGDRLVLAGGTGGFAGVQKRTFVRDAQLFGACLTGAPPAVSLSGGGAQTLTLRAALLYAQEPWVVLGSFTGTSPGNVLEGYLLPLNLDPYTLHTLRFPNTPPVIESFALLDPQGSATGTFAVPPLTNPVLAGLTLHHAALVLRAAPTPGIAATSNAVPVLLAP